VLSDRIEELEVLIRARYPIIYVVSWEEDRVERCLVDIAAKRNKKVYCWSFTRGITKPGAPLSAQKGRGSSTTDPMSALNQLVNDVEASIYLFKDFHTFMEPQNTAVIRQLREVAAYLKDTYKTLVICSPFLRIAPELQKDITVIDFPLPDIEDLRELLHNILSEVKEQADITVELDKPTEDRILQAALGLTSKEAENALAKTLVIDGKLDADDVSIVFSEKQQIIRKSGLLEYYPSSETLDDVGGLDALKEWLERRRLAFGERAREFGLPAPKGILLLGVQGCGKSLCAKAVSRAWELPLLRFDVGKMFGSLVGSSEDNIRRAIAIAESVSPAILWADEIDKAFSGTQSSGMTDGGTTSRVFATFLTWLSEKTAPVFVIATANDISALPPELLRKGRLDEIFFVDLPQGPERRDILTIHLTKRGRDPEKFDLEELVRHTEEFSGAEIEEAIITALYDAFYLDKDLESEDLLRSIRATVPLSKTMSETIMSLRSWAEGRARRATVAAGEERAHVKRKLEM
jgi:ATP-dependent 26S proteasome regulatory subunit